MKKLIVFFNILLLSIFTIYLFKDIFSTKNLQKEPINTSIKEFKKKNEVHEQSKFKNSLSPLNLDFTNAAQKTVNAANKAFTDATIRRQEGTLTVYDYSTVQNAYLAAVSDALSAKYDAQFKAFILKFYMQSPLKETKDVQYNEKLKNE